MAENLQEVTYLDILRRLCPGLPGLPADAHQEGSQEAVFIQLVRKLSQKSPRVLYGLLLHARFVYGTRLPRLPVRILEGAQACLKSWNEHYRLVGEHGQGYYDRNMEAFSRWAGDWLLFLGEGDGGSLVVRPPIGFDASVN